MWVVESSGRESLILDRSHFGSEPQLQLPYWQLWRLVGILWARASLHHWHFPFELFAHAQAMSVSLVVYYAVGQDLRLACKVSHV